MSRITKSFKIVTFATTTGTSSQIPTGIAVDLSAICKDISVGVNLFKSSLRYKERGITLIAAPRSHNTTGISYFAIYHDRRQRHERRTAKVFAVCRGRQKAPAK